MEIDLCHAVAGALFEGDWRSVEFVAIESTEEGDRLLQEGTIDIFAGAHWSFRYLSSLPHNGTETSFSMPYYYDNNADAGEEENLCLATSSRDHGWAVFVNWLVWGLYQAEEDDITSETADNMQEIYVFGPNHPGMLREAVRFAGNYGELYAKTVERIHPRSGRNLLNAGTSPGPQHYPLQGLF